MGVEMTSLSGNIRTFLKSDNRGHPAEVIGPAVGETDLNKVHYAVSSMVNRHGYLSKQRVGRIYHYWFVRDPCKKRARAYETNRNDARKKERAEKRARKLARKQAGMAASRALRQADTGFRDQEIMPANGHTETVEEFIARGGVIQRLGMTETALSAADLAALFVELV